MSWLTLTLALGLAVPPPAPEPRAEFMAQCAEAVRGDDPFFGEAQVEDLRQRLASAAGADRATLLGQLGHHLRRLDRLPEAIEAFEAALAALPEEPADEDLRLQLLRDLALTHMLLGEAENCVTRHVRSSCILPIEREAAHVRPEHTRRAAELWAAYLEKRPYNVQVRWLYNVARMVAGDDPASLPEAWRLPAGALAPDAAFPRWRNIASDLGVDSFDLSGGAVMDDFDGDGLLDLISSTWDPCGSMKAFRNDGRGGFEDVGAAWGLDAQFGGLNFRHADFDNDGKLDLLVLRGAWRGRGGEIRNSLLKNDLGGPRNRFVDVTADAGLTGAYPTQTAEWGDYDGDGDLDLYVGNEASADRPYPSQLFRNDGDGTFTDVAADAGVTNLRFAKGVAWGDYDDDGDLDLYVSNIGVNRLYRNDGAGEDGQVTFTDVAFEAGVSGPEDASFATWFFDFDNDGDLDLLVADYQSPYQWVSASYLGTSRPTGHPVLYRNHGGLFADESAQVGLARPLLPMGANYGDLDNDGFPDVCYGTGKPDLESVMPNVMYRNDAGRRFLDVTFAGGFGHLQKGHSIAFGDLDNDGDQDIFQQLGGAYPVDAYFNALYENPGSGDEAGRGWITLRLEGRRANLFGVGARIEVKLRRGEESRSVHVLAGAGGSFGASSLQQEIGLGDAEAIEEIVVRWPGSGTRQVFADVGMRRFYRVIEGEGELVPIEVPRIELAADGREHRHPVRPR